MLDKLQQFERDVELKLETIQTLKQLNDYRIEILSKNGAFSNFMQELKNVPKEQKPIFGQKINELKTKLLNNFETKQKLLNEKELNEKLAKESIDISLPGYNFSTGSKHPMNIVIDEIISIFEPLGYQVEEGPEIETDHYNFEMLNRDLWKRRE